MTTASLESARRLLCALQAHIRETITRAQARGVRRFATVAAVTTADTIYRVDKLSEAAIAEWFEAHWPKRWPVQVVMEGVEDEAGWTFPRGTPVVRTVWKCILDPIDGTRGLMYDKRSAWVLGGLAPQRGVRTELRDIVVAAMTELPTAKMWRSDQLSAVRGGGVVATATDVRAGGAKRRLRLRPSTATHFEHGFASLARFFPDGKAFTAELEEALWRELGAVRGTSPLIFDDQYISTGGQLYELIVGHDRMLGDLRPMVFKKLGLSRALVCHPYDLCTQLIAQEAGCLIEAPAGGAVRAPLDTTTPVAWMGYANATLARRVRPVLRRLIRERCG